ncbi:MAG: phosphatidylserine decarboxylase family protein [Candidatus Binatia bacterium]
MKIAAEGYPFILVALGLSVLAFILGWSVIGVVGAGFSAFFILFFRDPERYPPDGEGFVLAPADGRVVSVVKTENAPLMEGVRVRVSIFMSPLDVHVNRMPAAATVEELRHKAGKFFAAYQDDAVEHNEQNAMRIADPDGRKLGVVQVAGFLARRVVCKARKGDTYNMGERFGLIMFGSRTDLYLPPDAHIEVAEGQKVKGGETVVGRFV